jgi:hypothetical protein
MAIEKWEDSWDTFFSHEFASIMRRLMKKKGKIDSKSSKGKSSPVNMNDCNLITTLLSTSELNKILEMGMPSHNPNNANKENQDIYCQLLTSYSNYINKMSYLKTVLESGINQVTPSTAGLPPRQFVPYSVQHAPLVPCNHQCKLIGFFDSWQLGYQVVYHHRHHRYLPTTIRPTEGLSK